MSQEKRKTPRPRRIVGATYEIKTGCGEVYVTCNDADDGRLFELFVKLGKSGGCPSATSEAVGKLASIALRSGTASGDLIKGLAGIQCHKSPSCLDAIAVAIREHEEGKEAA
jgi:ribonucleoside-diphosphate reductase alpha chain